MDTLRGQSVDKPVLLFLHGGAGTSEMGVVRKYNSDLEKHFIGVNWDQRAAGKSCTREARASELSVDRFVKERLGYELVLNRAREQGIEKAIVELQKIDAPTMSGR